MDAPSLSTDGIQLDSRHSWLRRSMELLSSMRFAISLLTVICIASVIGTVLKQNEPLNNYINQFGPFWADVFGRLLLYTVYSSWWFLLILAFLVLSTSLCIARNTPKIWAELKTHKENIRHQSLLAFHHKAQGSRSGSPQQNATQLSQELLANGWKVKLQKRERDGTGKGSDGWMISAKAGAANKIGYIAAHSAIVLVCVGGLLDGDLFTRAQTWFGGKSVYSGGGLIADVPEQHRLSQSNPAFRGNLLVAEGTASNVAILSQPRGVLLQELPFTLELKKFIVEYYSTGMPKLFASDIVIHDNATGEKQEARVEVNHPASYKGIEIYQSSFDDGGSRVKLRAHPMSAAVRSFEVEGTVGSSTSLSNGEERLTLEFTGLRVINVENMADANGNTSGADVRKVDLQSAIVARLGAGHKTSQDKQLRNVGPSVSYKLRDAAGQAREYNNYMLPMDIGQGQSVFLLGTRDTPNESFRYLRVPADENGSLDGFTRLRQALQSVEMRRVAIERYARKSVEATRPDLITQLSTSAERAIDIFLGHTESAAAATTQGSNTPPAEVGLQALATFIERNIPEAERARAGDMFIRILNGVIYELEQLSRQRAGLKALPEEKVAPYLSTMVLALSDAPLYPAPMVLMPVDFTQVQASVFQVARAPGKTVVYLGCLFLILGVFAMLYVRERRLWIWIAPSGAATEAATAAQPAPHTESHAETSHITLALSTNRKTRDTDEEFARLRAGVLGS